MTKFVRSKDGTTRLDPITGLKICCRCKESKTADKFSKGASRRDGLSPRCKACQSIAGSANYKLHRERVIAARVARDINNPERAMLRAARKRAKEGGFPFDLKEEDIHIPGRCPIKSCGRLLAANAGGGRALSGSPSLDKYIPALGYVRGNIWIVCHECNLRKSNLSGEEHVALGMDLIDSFKEECERISQLHPQG